MYFPDELVLEILQHLHNIDLKAARLVCKRWSCSAAEFLFTKLFISLDQVNLDVFQSVCHHPLLSRCVRHLQYDRIRLTPDIELSSYTNALLRETWERLQFSEQRPIETDDLQRTEFYSIVINALRGKHDRDFHEPPAFRQGAKAKCMTFDFIRIGFQRYVTESQLQKRYIGSRNVESIVVNGLKNLDHLDAVTISEAGLHPQLGMGSLLARSWKSQSDWPNYVFVSSPSSQKYSVITIALSKAQKHIHHLKSEGAIRDLNLDVKTHDSRPHHEIYIHAYHELKSLHLTFELEYCLSRDITYLDHMHELLQSMSGLQDLRLAFRVGPGNTRRSRMHHLAIFPEFRRWTQLTTLRIENMTFSTKALMELIVLRMPSLHHLTLFGINLLEEKWEGVFEFLHCAELLQSLQLFDPNKRGLYTRQRPWYRWNSTTMDENNFSFPDDEDRDPTARRFQEYVIGSRRNPASKHPSLRPRQPREESRTFLADILSHLEAVAGGADSELIVRMNELIGGNPTHR